MIKSILIKICICCILFYSPLILYTQDSIQISLLSCSPGAELYSTFGHSAFRVKEFSTGKDLVFNYGTFNFDDKKFYLKFLQGKLNYYLTVSTFDRFMYEYTVDNRAVYEQVFSLDKEQKANLYNDLKQNALPENRDYKYDFFWDNCSTRIRDMIQNQFSTSLSYPILKVKPFRSYLHDYLSNQPWSEFGIDLILGLPCDAPAGAREAMFLPLEMMKVYDSTFFQSRLVATHSHEILTSVLSKNGTVAITPLVITFGICLLTIAFYYFNGRNTWGILLCLLTGLAGCIIFFLWFLSDHLTTKNNLHFIWANPLLLLYPIRKKIFNPALLTPLSSIYFILLLALLMFFPINIQKMPLACIPIWLSLMIVIWPETIFYNKLMNKRIKKHD